MIAVDNVAQDIILSCHGDKEQNIHLTNCKKRVVEKRTLVKRNIQ